MQSLTALDGVVLMGHGSRDPAGAEEFLALLEDCPLSARVVIDVALGALDARRSFSAAMDRVSGRFRQQLGQRVGAVWMGAHGLPK